MLSQEKGMDVCRTITRRTERCFIVLRDRKERIISDESIKYLIVFRAFFTLLHDLQTLGKGIMRINPNTNS